MPLPEPVRCLYMRGMRDFLIILLGLDMIAVVAVLLTGALGMTTGADPRRQNRLMRWRVGLQAVAIALVVILLLSSR
ncbi:twin transmembrane helix small protein [Acidiphilium iwatense]|nr:twin transmembrane helix small protein [Acidiphilium iwatense]